MREVETTIEEFGRSIIDIGRVGENGVTKLSIDVSSVSILMQPRVLSCDNRTEKIIPHHPHLTG